MLDLLTFAMTLIYFIDSAFIDIQEGFIITTPIFFQLLLKFKYFSRIKSNLLLFFKLTYIVTFQHEVMDSRYDLHHH